MHNTINTPKRPKRKFVSENLEIDAFQNSRRLRFGLTPELRLFSLYV